MFPSGVWFGYGIASQPLSTLLLLDLWSWGGVSVNSVVVFGADFWFVEDARRLDDKRRRDLPPDNHIMCDPVIVSPVVQVRARAPPVPGLSHPPLAIEIFNLNG